ncbi:MAG: AtpZ/AtpI family protein [Candidatus Zixiibacteriota bacterium]
MSLLSPRRSDRELRDYRQASLYIAIPAIMLAAPIIGFLIGRWLDKVFGTEPYLTGIGSLFGIAAAGLETYYIIRKGSAIDKEKDDDSEPRP